MNQSTIEQLETLSVATLQAQLPGNIAWVVICVATFVLSSFFVSLYFPVKMLKVKNQLLIIALTVDDVVQAIAWGTVGVKRVYLAVSRIPELTNQVNCVCWMWGMNFTIFNSQYLLVCIGIERMTAVGLPNWYKQHNYYMKLVMLGVMLPLALVFASIGLLGSSYEVLNLSCAASMSYPPYYGLLLTIYENGTVVSVVLVTACTCFTVWLRYRKAVRMRTNIRTFKQDVELQALVTLLVLLVVFVLSTASSSALIALVRNSGMTDFDKGKFGPISGCLHLSRGLLDACVYLSISGEHRTAARSRLVRLLFCCGGNGRPDNAAAAVASRRIFPSNIQPNSLIRRSSDCDMCTSVFQIASSANPAQNSSVVDPPKHGIYVTEQVRREDC